MSSNEIITGRSFRFQALCRVLGPLLFLDHRA